MNISGILVVVQPERLEETVEVLRGLPAVEVHHTEPATGRIVITQEAASIDDEVEGLKRIQALPHIILAEMVHHYFEQDRGIVENSRNDHTEGRPFVVPPFLDE